MSHRSSPSVLVLLALTLALPFVAVRAHAQTRLHTAYQALNYFRDRAGGLDHVLLVQGEGGTPQPEEWIIYQGQITAALLHASGIFPDGSIHSDWVHISRTRLPVHPELLNFAVLNVDSNAAFRIATREAAKESFYFNRIDYQLRTNTIADVPAWTLTMYNEKKGLLAEMTISGCDGSILYPVRIHSYAVESVNGQEVAVRTRESFCRKAARSVKRWFIQTGVIFGSDALRSASTTEEIIVGHRTLDNDLDDY